MMVQRNIRASSDSGQRSTKSETTMKTVPVLLCVVACAVAVPFGVYGGYGGGATGHAQGNVLTGSNYYPYGGSQISSVNSLALGSAHGPGSASQNNAHASLANFGHGAQFANTGASSNQFGGYGYGR